MAVKSQVFTVALSRASAYAFSRSDGFGPPPGECAPHGPDRVFCGSEAVANGRRQSAVHSSRFRRPGEPDPARTHADQLIQEGWCGWSESNRHSFRNRILKGVAFTETLRCVASRSLLSAFSTACSLLCRTYGSERTRQYVRHSPKMPHGSSRGLPVSIPIVLNRLSNEGD